MKQLFIVISFLFAICGMTYANSASRAGSPMTIRVAAANSSKGDRVAADLVCTGTNDEIVISRAIEILERGGTVKLADGDYYIDSFPYECNTAIFFGYNNGQARTINVVGGTENKSYNTRFGVGIHVTEHAFAKMNDKGPYCVFRGTLKRPDAPGAFFRYTHVNNVNIRDIYILFHDASKPVRGIDGTGFGNMYLCMVGVFTERYFEDRFMHVKPAPPSRGCIGVVSVPGSNDEASRIGYDYVNVGGLHTGFLFRSVDHLVMKACSAARCCYGYRAANGSPKTMTWINCCDEGNAHLPYLEGKGHLTAIDFNIERLSAPHIPDSSETTGPYAAEKDPGSWHGFISYTLQGKAFGLKKFWKEGHGVNFRTVNLDHSLTERPRDPEYLETFFDKTTNKTLTWNGAFWVDAMGVRVE